jgi:hypothetical protein
MVFPCKNADLFPSSTLIVNSPLLAGPDHPLETASNPHFQTLVSFKAKQSAKTTVL